MVTGLALESRIRNPLVNDLAVASGRGREPESGSDNLLRGARAGSSVALEFMAAFFVHKEPLS